MPVYNGEKTLSEAIDSILHQTFTDFELLIIEGGSNDRSVEIIESYNDPRIHLIVQEEKYTGFAGKLNQGLAIATGEYIARMDCDDISLPNRLLEQVEFLEQNPEIGICGSWIKLFGEKKGIIKYPTTSKEIKVESFFRNPLAHPSVMIRKKKFDEHKLHFDTKYKIVEDYDLWIRCIDYFSLANLPKVLLNYRVTSSSLYHSNIKTAEGIYFAIFKKQMKALGIPFTKKEYEIHFAITRLSFSNFKLEKQLVKKMKRWLLKIYNANLEFQVYHDPYFYERLAQHWFWICYKSKRLGFWVWRTYRDMILNKFSKIPWSKKVKLFLLAILFELKRIF